MKRQPNDDSIDSSNECYRDHCSCCESMKPKFIKHGQSLLLVFHVLAFFYGFLQFQRPSSSSETQNNQQIILLYTIVLLGLSIAQMIASHRRDKLSCLLGSKILSYLYFIWVGLQGLAFNFFFLVIGFSVLNGDSAANEIGRHIVILIIIMLIGVIYWCCIYGLGKSINACSC